MNTVFFEKPEEIIAVQLSVTLGAEDAAKLEWLFQAPISEQPRCTGLFVGPRREVITPWSTNATEIAGHIGFLGIHRIERFVRVKNDEQPVFDPMLEEVYQGLTQTSLVISQEPEPSRVIENIRAYNEEAGLALSDEEIDFLEREAATLGRMLTDTEVYGFSQINSEHCRHKIFNGTFVLDGKPQEKSLFALIKDTAKAAPEELVSAYKDNVAFVKGPSISLFAPEHPEQPDYFKLRRISSVLSLKAETHNFPTTVEPFYGASTGSGGEIRDRMAGGTGSIPLAGTAVYMTAYPRLSGSPAVEWEKHHKARNWKYQTPAQILIKASNGASDFGNKFGQPLITGSVLTYEGKTAQGFYGFDRAVMLAGGVGYTDARYAQKNVARPGDLLVLLGGDNYRIGMAGGSVSSVATGALSQALELSAVQRANPEMQKRVYNVIRALVEMTDNPILLIHDHGAGGHMNCFSELIEPLGGTIHLAQLPVGDPTLSIKEILCNESQERMGIVLPREHLPLIERIAEREQAPIYVIGEIGSDGKFLVQTSSGERPVDLPLSFLFGSSPKTELRDSKETVIGEALEYSIADGKSLLARLRNVLSLEAVACKDWLTNKVDRSVTGLVARQQTVGPLQLPLNDVGVMALDYSGTVGIATALGHAPVLSLLDERAASVISIAESLTNLVWAPLTKGLAGVVLSANWMWPARQRGEDAKLYQAVDAVSTFAQQLGLPIPTGKDSLSMTMRYEDGSTVKAPGTVVITAMGECSDVKLCVTPDLKPVQGSELLYFNLSSEKENPLGGSSFAQSLGQLGDRGPTVQDAEVFSAGFAYIQRLLIEKRLLAGHDVSSGGLVAAICEMSFAGDIGVDINLSGSELEVVPKLFCEKPGVVIQVPGSEVQTILEEAKALRLMPLKLGEVRGTQIRLHAGSLSFSLSVADLRRTWFKPSFLLDSKQTKSDLAKARYEHFDAKHLSFSFPEGFTGRLADAGVDLHRTAASGIKAAIIRDKGTNGDRELAYAMFAAGFDVKDVTMSDLMTGRESLDDVRFVAFPGGFSNSDVLGAGRGWAAMFRYNQRALDTLQRFLGRPDTLSLGVCNGCQVLVAMDMIYPEHVRKMAMLHNESGKFESTFLNVRVQETQSILLKPLVGSQLGIWVAHGEGRFHLPEGEEAYDIPLKYVSAEYPANPNGSDWNAAAICSRDGRHLVLMPHLERSMFSWNWPYHGKGEIPEFEISPWILTFTSARTWIQDHT